MTSFLLTSEQKDYFLKLAHEHRLEMDAKVAELEAALAQMTAERDQLQAELDQANFDAVWSVAEHERAWKAIQQAEGLDPNHYPSFQERVWWKAFKQRADAAEAHVVRLQLALQQIIDNSNESNEWDAVQKLHENCVFAEGAIK